MSNIFKKPSDSKATVFIDIDGTILDKYDEPLELSIETIKTLSKKVNIYIWSAGGVTRCNEVVKTFDLYKYICGFMPKPDMIIDDLDEKKLLRNKHYYPNWKKISELSDEKLNGCFVDDKWELCQE